MIYHVYNPVTGEHLGWSEDPGPDRTTVAPPDPTDTSVGFWNGSAWEARPRPFDPSGHVADAWSAAHNLIESAFDTYSQISATNLRMDPACPAWRAQRIGDVLLWISSVWAHYGSVRASLYAGQMATFNPASVGPCPWTIWQIAAAEP